MNTNGSSCVICVCLEMALLIISWPEHCWNPLFSLPSSLGVGPDQASAAHIAKHWNAVRLEAGFRCSILYLGWSDQLIFYVQPQVFSTAPKMNNIYIIDKDWWDPWHQGKPSLGRFYEIDPGPEVTCVSIRGEPVSAYLQSQMIPGKDEASRSVPRAGVCTEMRRGMCLEWMGRKIWTMGMMCFLFPSVSKSFKLILIFWN